MNNLQQSQHIGSIIGHTFPVTSIAFSPDGETLVSSGDNTVRLWNLSSRKAIKTLKGHTDNWSASAVTSMVVSPNGQFIASGGTDNTIRIWNLKDVLKSNRGNIQVLTGHSKGSWWAPGVRAVTFSCDGQILASGGSDKIIKLWNTTTWQELSTLTGHSDVITSLAFSPVEQILISATSCTIKVWKIDTEEEMTITTPSSPSSVCFNPNGQFFTTGGLKGMFSLWAVNTAEEVVTETLHSEEISCVAFSSDGQFFATGSHDTTVKLWDATTHKLLNTLTGHSDVVYSLAFCPDNSILASGSADKTIRLWKVL